MTYSNMMIAFLYLLRLWLKTFDSYSDFVGFKILMWNFLSSPADQWFMFYFIYSIEFFLVILVIGQFEFFLVILVIGQFEIFLVILVIGQFWNFFVHLMMVDIFKLILFNLVISWYFKINLVQFCDW